MSRVVFLILLFVLFFGVSCDETSNLLDSIDDSESPYVAIGDSLTAGVQSDGLEDDFQVFSFPNLIAQQMGIDDFEQPLIGSPGIGFDEPETSPLMFENGEIFREQNIPNPFDLLGNFFLSRPYDNLGLPGAELVDVQSTSMLLFEVILRGMGTQLEQAIRLDPGLITLWVGNNDVLGVANGGDVADITPIDEFEEDYREILEELTTETDAMIVAANVPNVTDIPFINFYDAIFRTVPELGITNPVPVLYDPDTFEPIDFGDGRLVPFLTQETDVVHVLIDILIDDDTYEGDGVGIPDQEALESMGFSAGDASNIVSQLEMMGLMPTGIMIDEDSTLTNMEEIVIGEAINDINNTIAELLDEFNISLVDINDTLSELNTNGIDGFTGNFVLDDVENTAFSLDGIHANNAGYAIIANRFINVINQSFAMDIPLVDTQQFRGQYSN